MSVANGSFPLVGVDALTLSPEYFSGKLQNSTLDLVILTAVSGR